MNVQRYARIAGVLFLVSLVAGGFGEAYVPSKIIVSGDAAATAANIRNFDFLYRLGFAGFLIESLPRYFDPKRERKETSAGAAIAFRLAFMTCGARLFVLSHAARA